VRLPGYAKSLFAHAQGIEAEIPQDLHRQIRGIGAESPTPPQAGMRPNSSSEKFLILNFSFFFPLLDSGRRFA
jgi:hypothetical protein